MLNINQKYKLLGVFFVLLISFVALSGFVTAADVNSTSGDNGIYCTMHVNPSTGYHWEPRYDSSNFKYLCSDFVSDNPDLCGSPGYQTFSFLPLKSDVPTTMDFDLIAPDGSVVDHATLNLSGF